MKSFHYKLDIGFQRHASYPSPGLKNTIKFHVNMGGVTQKGPLSPESVSYE